MEKEILTIENGVVTACDKEAVNVVIPEGVTAIGKEAFDRCSKLLSVKIPEGVTEIGYRSFNWCTKLEEANIPESVVKIGNCAFETCQCLKSIAIPDGVKEIGNNAFDGCWLIKSVTLRGVETIGFDAFNRCSSLESLVIGGNVKFIDKYAFSHCKSLVDVTYCGTKAQWEAVKGRMHVLNNVGVKSVKCTDGEWVKPAVFVENGHLVECIDKSIKSITIGGVSEIDRFAFNECLSLEDVVIEEDVTRICAGAFCGCTALKSVVIPSSVTKIEDIVFKDCPVVESVVSKAEKYPFDEKKRKLYDATGKRKMAILTLTAAKEEAKKEKIEKVQNVSASAVLDSILGAQKNLRPTVRRDGKEAYLCIDAGKGGIEIVLADSKVSKWMQSLPALLEFASTCTDEVALRKYALDNDFEDTSRKFLYVRYGKGKVRADTKPIHIVISDEVTEIQEKGFYECGSLKSVVLPSTVKKIGEKAFGDCFNLSSLFIPESVKEICKDAFSGCNSLYEIDFGGTVAQWEAVEKNDVWNNNCHVKTVKCTDGDWKRPVLLIEDGVVVGKLYNKMTSITIPDGVTKIGKWAFAYCYSLTSVVIGEGVTKIGDYAFYFCTSLSSVVIGEGVTEIGGSAFWGCDSLSSVVIPASVTEIGAEAFCRCESLSSVVIPAGVTKIGWRAFRWCKSLSSVEFGGTMAQWEAIGKGEDWNEDVPAETVKCTDGKSKL